MKIIAGWRPNQSSNVIVSVSISHSICNHVISVMFRESNAALNILSVQKQGS